MSGKRQPDTPDDKYARRRVQGMVRDGKLPRASSLKCSCGNKAREYHHPDYSKPEQVIPLCLSCHRKITFRFRKKRYIGPVTKHGQFYSPTAEARRRRNA